MFSLSLLNLNHCPFIPSHSHKEFQLCLLLRGRMEIWRAAESGHPSAMSILDAYMEDLAC